MGFLDRILGRAPQGGGPQGVPNDNGQQGSPYPTQPNARNASNSVGQTPGASMTDDERAIARYEYMLKTAPPEEIETAHAEAFAKLTPEQRQQVLTRLATASPQDAPQDASPQNLARAATRAEMRQPGLLTSSFGGVGMGGLGGGFGGGGFGRMGGGGGMGMGSMLLTSVAGAFVGTAVADAMFDGFDGFGGFDGGWGNDFDTADMHDAYEEGLHDGGGFDDGFDGGGFDGGDFGGGDFGGDFGGFDL